MTLEATTRARLPWVIPASIVAAWMVALAAEASGVGARLHHDALIEHGPPLWVGLLAFLLAWQVMVAAMMLPSSLPLIRMFAVAARGQSRPGAVLMALVCGYVLVWTVFGAFAFMGDAVVHRTVDSTPWLAERPWMVAGSVILTAGLFQFTSLKDRCLDRCRHPALFMTRYYRRGTRPALDLGIRHGAFCLGCCWALMLLMFAVGVAHLAWMVALTTLMVYEKVGRRGPEVGKLVGACLVVLAVAVLTQPSWAPEFLLAPFSTS
jgi:predicted metal-binding membrane protein